MFNRVGQITIDGAEYTEDQILEAGLDAGLEDVQAQDDIIIAMTSPSDVFDVKDVLVKSVIRIESAEITKQPANWIGLNEKEAGKALQLLEILEECDDVQAVHTNFEIREE